MAVNARLRWSRAVGWLHLLFVTAGCVVLIGTYGVRIVQVIGVSMAPTLNDGDRIQIGSVALTFRSASVVSTDTLPGA